MYSQNSDKYLEIIHLQQLKWNTELLQEDTKNPPHLEFTYQTSTHR